jgi:alpha-beta hydrolase superfamily lysophospholipase
MLGWSFKMSKEAMLPTEKGREIFYRVWRPAKKPKAAVVISHGYAEHSGRYEHVAARLNSAGYVVYANDHQGHGKTPGKRAHIESPKVLIHDTKSIVDLVRQNEGAQLPIFLLGHSMGSWIAVHFAAEYPGILRGLVLSGAGVRLPDISPSQERQISLGSKLSPGKMMTAEFDASRLSHDQGVVDAYKSDPMIFAGTASLSLLKTMVDMLNKEQEKAKTLKLPILFQKAGDDKVVLGHKELFDSFTGVADKTLKVYDGFYHEIYNETSDRRKVALDDLVSWLDKHV